MRRGEFFNRSYYAGDMERATPYIPASTSSGLRPEGKLSMERLDEWRRQINCLSEQDYSDYVQATPVHRYRPDEVGYIFNNSQRNKSKSRKGHDGTLFLLRVAHKSRFAATTNVEDTANGKLRTSSVPEGMQFLKSASPGKML